MNGHLIMRVLAGTGLLLTILCVQPWRPGMRVAAQMIPNQVGSQSGGIFASDPLDDPRIRAHQRKTLNEQRQKELLSDTQKLLQATRELHNEMIS
ncbi:MAG: hypothetical protein KGN79_12580, partial [Acidobacteriota bacterium]|nr:hypothetical protein [Acidobacteriota bacterium]